MLTCVRLRFEKKKKQIPFLLDTRNHDVLLRNWLENGPATLCRILRVSRRLGNVTHFMRLYVWGFTLKQVVDHTKRTFTIKCWRTNCHRWENFARDEQKCFSYEQIWVSLFFFSSNWSIFYTIRSFFSLSDFFFYYLCVHSVLWNTCGIYDNVAGCLLE